MERYTQEVEGIKLLLKNTIHSDMLTTVRAGNAKTNDNQRKQKNRYSRILPGLAFGQNKRAVC